MDFLEFSSPYLLYMDISEFIGTVNLIKTIAERLTTLIMCAYFETLL